MSDVYSNQGPSLKGTATARQEADSNREEIDADTAVGHQQDAFHDSRYWHAACRVRDCKLGFPECKVGSSCCKAGWKNALEEPLGRSRSLAAVAMLPSLLSNLAVSRTRSDPCIFGKDFLTISLPLPGETSDCRVKGLTVKRSESGTSEKMGEPMNLVGSGIQEDNNPGLEASTSPFILTCEKNSARSGNDNLFSNFVARMQDDDDSIHNITGTRIDDIKEHKIQSPDEISHDFGVIFSDKTLGNLGDMFFDENAAANSPMDGVSNSFRISRTPQWDDWWTFRSNESSQRSKHSGQRRIKYRSESKEHSLASIEIDQAEEDGSDEGYLVLEEGADQQLGRFEDEGDACDGEEESIFYAKQYNSDYLEEELFKEENNADNNSKEYKEDDIWSDEHFVSSQVKGFPPPISILANETHPGLPGHMPRTLWRSVKRDGRFVLQEVQAQPREFFRATRECGRLRLQLVRPDSDPVGRYTEVVDIGYEADSAGAVSIACSRSIENLAGISNTIELDDYGIVHKDDVSGTSIQGIDAPQPEDCWTAQRSAKLDAALDQDGGAKLVGRLMPSVLLPKECGSVLEGETSGACSGQICTEMFGVRSPFYAGLKEVPDSTGRDLIIKVSCVTNHSQIYEESRGGKMVLDEIVDITTNHIIANESVVPDSGQEEAEKVSEVVKVGDREKPVSFSPSGVQVLEVGVPLDTGLKPIVGQIDGGHKVQRIGVVNLRTKLDVGEVEEGEDLGMINHSTVVMVHGHEEQLRQDYEHPCVNSTYGFDNNLKPFSPSQAFMQFPIQPAVR